MRVRQRLVEAIETHQDARSRGVEASVLWVVSDGLIVVLECTLVVTIILRLTPLPLRPHPRLFSTSTRHTNWSVKTSIRCSPVQTTRSPCRVPAATASEKQNKLELTLCPVPDVEDKPRLGWMRSAPDKHVTNTKRDTLYIPAYPPEVAVKRRAS